MDKLASSRIEGVVAIGCSQKDNRTIEVHDIHEDFENFFGR
jgi:hypothetical protein